MRAFQLGAVSISSSYRLDVLLASHLLACCRRAALAFPALQLRRAHQLLGCYRAVAALRSDEAFQEDASDPAVQAALQEMALANSFEK